MRVDLLIRNARIVACDRRRCASRARLRRRRDGRIAAIGTMQQLDAGLRAKAELDAEAALLTPA
jgi:predicted amidohydrolase